MWIFNKHAADVQVSVNIIIIIIIIIHYIYIALFWVLKALYMKGGGGVPQPPPVCSIHLDKTMAAILRQDAHHTPANWWRGDRVMKPISVWGWLGGHDGQRPMGKFGQDAGVTPLLFFFFCYQQFFIFIFLQTTQHNIQNKTKQNSRHTPNI